MKQYNATEWKTQYNAKWKNALAWVGTEGRGEMPLPTARIGQWPTSFAARLLSMKDWPFISELVYNLWLHGFENPILQKITWTYLTLSHGEGWGWFIPLSFFADSEKTAAHSTANLLVRYGAVLAQLLVKIDQVWSSHGAMTSFEEQPPAELLLNGRLLRNTRLQWILLDYI